MNCGLHRTEPRPERDTPLQGPLPLALLRGCVSRANPGHLLHHLDHLLCCGMGGVGPAEWLYHWAPYIAAEHDSDLDD
jgi:hypothetical protein